MPAPETTALAGDQIATDRKVSDRERSVALRSALKGGAVAAVFSIFPAGFLVGMPLGGFLAVVFYRRRSWRAERSFAAGFRLGALAGAFAFVLFGLFLAAQFSSPHVRDELRQQMLDRLHTLESRTSDPQQQRVIDYLKTPDGITVSTITGAVFFGIISVVLAGVGGAISAAMVRPKGPME